MIVTLAASSAATTPEITRLVNSRDAARMLAISPRTLWRLGATGKIPRLKVGGCVRFSVEAIDDYIEKQQEVAACQPQP